MLTLRSELKDSSDPGDSGARAIHAATGFEGVHPLPSTQPIGRIPGRRGARDGCERTRRPPPPAGWYLSKVATRRVELDSFDAVEGPVSSKYRGGSDDSDNKRLVHPWCHRMYHRRPGYRGPGLEPDEGQLCVRS